MALVATNIGSPWFCLALVVILSLYRNDLRAALGRLRRIELPGVKVNFDAKDSKTVRAERNAVPKGTKKGGRTHLHTSRLSK
jgi:hypothetical protein